MGLLYDSHNSQELRVYLYKVRTEWSLQHTKVFCEERTVPACISKTLLCRGSGGWSPASHRGNRGSIPVQPMLNLSWMKWRWDTFLSEHFGFPLSVSFHYCFILTFAYMLLLPEAQTDDTREPSKKQCYFVNRGAWDRKVLAPPPRRLVARLSPRRPGFLSRAKNCGG